MFEKLVVCCETGDPPVSRTLIVLKGSAVIITDFDKIGTALGIKPSEREWLTATVLALQGKSASSLSENEIIKDVSVLLQSRREHYDDLRMEAFVSSGGNPRYYGRKS